MNLSSHEGAASTHNLGNLQRRQRVGTGSSACASCVAVFGGQFYAGRVPDGGFAVRATPYESGLVTAGDPP